MGKGKKGANKNQQKPKLTYNTSPWLPDENNRVIEELHENLTTEQIAVIHNRSHKGIIRQIKKLALKDYENGLSIVDINNKYISVFAEDEFQYVLEKRKKINEKMEIRRQRKLLHQPISILDHNKLKEDFENLKIEFDNLKDSLKNNQSQNISFNELLQNKNVISVQELEAQHDK
jgi:hypothetical protein